MLRKAAYWAVWWLALMLCYLLLVAKLEGEEAVAGAVAAGLAAAAAVATHEAGALRFRLRWSWLGPLARIPGRILIDCGIVAVALWRTVVLRRHIQGEFRYIPFHVGSKKKPESLAHRALVIAGISVAPNTFVVALDAQHGRLLVHQLIPSAQPPGGGDRDWPL